MALLTKTLTYFKSPKVSGILNHVCTLKDLDLSKNIFFVWTCTTCLLPAAETTALWFQERKLSLGSEKNLHAAFFSTLLPTLWNKMDNSRQLIWKCSQKSTLTYSQKLERTFFHMNVSSQNRESVQINSLIHVKKRD